MRTKIAPFEPALLPAVIRFAERTWDRPRTEQYYRWRFLECPADTLLALRGEDCVGVISAFRKPYRVGSERLTYLETFDWYCVPELQGAGLGILLLREMMKQPEPIVSVGGSPDTLALLPQMHWRTVAAAISYTLPLTGATIAAKVKELYGIPASITEVAFNASARFWFRPKGRRTEAAGKVVSESTIGEEVRPLYDGAIGYGTVQVADPSFFQWLIKGYPGGGHFVTFYFKVADKLRGWALAKVYCAPDSQSTDASLIDIYAPNPNTSLYTWMVSEIAVRLARYQPRKITALVTCPVLQAALRRNRFLKRETVPVQLWSRQSGQLPGPVHLTCNTGDFPFLPYLSSGHAPPQ